MRSLLNQLHRDGALTIDLPKLRESISALRLGLSEAKRANNRDQVTAHRLRLNFLYELTEVCYKHKINNIQLEQSEASPGQNETTPETTEQAE